MKVIEPKVELWLQDDNPVIHVAKCARVCYGKIGNEYNTEINDKRLYDNLIKNKHNSMFRHETVYAVIPMERTSEYTFMDYFGNPYIDIKPYRNDSIFVVTNGNFMIDYNNTDIYYKIKRYQITPREFENYDESAFNMMRYTFHIVTQISTSRELNRVSPNNIAEKSTRYVDESEGTICRPHWLSKDDAELWNKGGLRSNPHHVYLCACDYAFNEYKYLIDNNFKREDARGVLPLDTATDCIYTYSIDEWKHIIKLRTAKSAHPNAQIIANMIKEQLQNIGYDI